MQKVSNRPVLIIDQPGFSKVYRYVFRKMTSGEVFRREKKEEKGKKKVGKGKTKKREKGRKRENKVRNVLKREEK